MPINLDFEGVSREGKFELLEPGDYELTVSDAEVKPAKEAGKYPTLWVTFECGNSTIREFLTFHPNSLWRVRQFLESATGTVIEGSIDFDEKELIGATVIATVGVKARQDKPDLNQNYIEAYALLDIAEPF